MYLSRYVRHLALMALVCGLALNGSASDGSASDKAKDPVDSTRHVETPAVPYLTLMIVRDATVHGELRLNRNQVEQIEAAVAEVDHPFWLLRDVPVDQCADKLDALVQQLRRQLKKILADEQRQRLDEILLQARGFNGLVSPETVARLELSTDQLAQLRTIARGNVRAARQGDSEPQPSGTPKLEARQLMEVLSSKQADEWARAFGSPFDVSRIRQVGCVAPELRSVDQWINSEPLTIKSLRGRVVVLHFWAFGCINCVHNLPHYQSWREKFPPSQVTILGVHTPETEPERVVDNLRESVTQRGIKYPVAVDAAAENWKAWGNNMWPSVYLIDKRGLVRNWWYGELNWQGARGEEFMRAKIAELLAEK